MFHSSPSKDSGRSLPTELAMLVERKTIGFELSQGDEK
jgi:hypothetical protein